MRCLNCSRFFLCIILLAAGYHHAAAQSKGGYWQQHVAYTIHVRLDDQHHLLRADETIVYTNNSPDTLSELFFHLWPNGYRNNRTPFARQRLAEGLKDFHDAPKSDRGFIDSLHFSADGKDIQTDYIDKSGEIARLKLNSPLRPGQSVRITTPFLVKIPKTFSRMGHSGQAYYISQWYPKPAVYDRHGWNTFPYLDQGEFYSEYGSFDVSITLPENYVVAATGKLQNASEISFLDSMAKANVIFNIDDRSNKLRNLPKDAGPFPASSSKYKTIEYIQDSVHDFAWFADKRYLVEKTDTVLPSGRKITCRTMYTRNQKPVWQGSAKYVAQTIGFYSQMVGEYPYPSATAISGDLMPSAGGMEYPMVTLISTKSGLQEVIVHEVGHNWFYGILGSNERIHAWMDEGINSFYEFLFKDKNITLRRCFKEAKKADNLFSIFQVSSTMAAYTLQARLGLDQPVDLPAAGYTQINYGTIVYGKTAGILQYLYFYLGKDEFNRIMHIYFERWKFKHPMPEDLKNLFEQEAKKDVSWFFKDLLFTDKKMDYAITSVKKNGNNYTITLKNTGGVAGPVFAAICNKDSILKDSVVFNPEKKYTITLSSGDAAGYALINPFPATPDVFRANNRYGIMPATGRFNPPHLQPFIGVERTDRTNILWAPAVAWNAQDKWMLGLMFSSDLLPPKRLSWQLMPMYGFGSKILTGMGGISYTLMPYAADTRHSIEFGVNAKRFSFDASVKGYYTKIQPFITWEFQHKPLANSIKHQVSIRSGYIYNHIGNPEPSYPDSSFPAKLIVNELKYTIHKGPYIRSLDAGIVFRNIPGTTNQLTAELVMRRPSPIHKQQIYFRLFAGTLVGNNTGNNRYFLPLGGIGGYQDFAYDNLYMDRTGKDRVFGQQLEPGGGFKFVTNTGAFSTNKWMVTSSLAANIPGLPAFLPLHLYLDGGIYSDLDNKLKEAYSGGVKISIWQGNFEVYFPLFYSADISNWMKNQYHSYGRQITFRANIKALDPRKLIKSNLE
jgi:hypothetical protein